MRWGRRITPLVLAAWLLAGCADVAPTDTGSAPVPEATTSGERVPAAVKVPDLAGDEVPDAVRAVRAAGLRASLADGTGEPDEVDFDPEGDMSGCTVSDQDPDGGQPANRGERVTVFVDCRQADWQRRDGDAWFAFDAAYVSGFRSGCDDLIARAADAGATYDEQDEATAACDRLAPEETPGAAVPSRMPRDPEAAGERRGRRDGCRALAEEGVLPLPDDGSDPAQACGDPGYSGRSG